ncbi:MAG: [LysW]-lysine hydrolase [Caldilineales bacterium]|nr:[LysW]-lysine hydrolase [Caldilineales bacterium]
MNASLTPPSPDLLASLLAIPSLSGQEGEATAFLSAWMAAHGFDASFVDAAGNAVGLRDGGAGPGGAPPRDIVLLGHIDTVPGEIAVRVEDGKLFGRGAVDAKGPLAAFAAAVAQVQPAPGWRLIVIGAVEEEAATSKGARFAAGQYHPALCIIGEPSGWERVTLGYKGRLLADVAVRQPMAHTAGPDAGVCEIAVAVWNRVQAQIETINAGRERAWQQVLPSIRTMASGSDGLTEWATLRLGFRLPEDLGPTDLQALIVAAAGAADVHFSGAEPAFRAEKNSPLARAFLAAIRSQGGRPGFLLKTGTSDMNVVGPAWGCPILAYGPGDSSLDHTPHEHVQVAEWQRGVAVLRGALAQVMTGIGVSLND